VVERWSLTGELSLTADLVTYFQLWRTAKTSQLLCSPVQDLQFSDKILHTSFYAITRTDLSIIIFILDVLIAYIRRRNAI